MKLIKNILLAFLVGAGVSALAETRSSSEYTCTAYNPLTGYAELKYPANEKDGSVGTLMTYGMISKSLSGGEISYDPKLENTYPRATLQTVINGVTVPVYMDLAKPKSARAKKATLIGVTYVPLFAVVPGSWLFQPYMGYQPGYSDVPIPAGFIPTSIVSCDVRFN